MLFEISKHFMFEKVSEDALGNMQGGVHPSLGVCIDPCLETGQLWEPSLAVPSSPRPFRVLCVIHFHSVCLHQPASVPAGLRAVL